MTIEELAEALAPMVMIVGKPLSKEQIKAWHVMLDDLDPATVRRAVVMTMRDYQYAGFPPVGVVRRNAGATAANVSDRPTIAWAAVKKAIATHGTYVTVEFDDPLTNAAVRMLGGWARFGDVEAGEAFDVWLKKDFIQTYETLSRTGVSAEMCGPLAGLDPSMTNAAGLITDQPHRIAIDLPKIASGIVKGEVEHQKPKSIEAPVKEFVESLGIPETPKPVSDESPADRDYEPDMTKRRVELELQIRAERQGKRLELVEAITDPKAKPFAPKN